LEETNLVLMRKTVNDRFAAQGFDPRRTAMIEIAIKATFRIGQVGRTGSRTPARSFVGHFTDQISDGTWASCMADWIFLTTSALSAATFSVSPMSLDQFFAPASQNSRTPPGDRLPRVESSSPQKRKTWGRTPSDPSHPQVQTSDY